MWQLNKLRGNKCSNKDYCFYLLLTSVTARDHCCASGGAEELSASLPGGADDCKSQRAG